MSALASDNWYPTSDTNEPDAFDVSSIILTSAATLPVTQGLPNVSAQQKQNVPVLQNSTISVSSAFYPNADNDNIPTDVILLTCDSVFFYAHKHKLLTASNNYFNYFFPILRQGVHLLGSANSTAASLAAQSKEHLDKGIDPDPVVPLPETSAIVNILLHAMYGKSLSHFMPSFEDLELSLSALARYGVLLQPHVAPGSPLFYALLDFASTNAMSIYTLAAKYNLYPLAVSVSPHLLSIPLSSLSDEMALQLGGCYTKRLFLLHIGRTDALKRLLLPPPRSHPSTFVCNMEEQDKLSRTWTLAGAHILWDAKADITSESMVNAMSKLGDELQCEVCKTNLRIRIATLSSEWGQIKMTI